MQPISNDRKYELDWLRTIAILILLFFHVGMIFVSWDFHIKNKEITDALEPLMVWLHRWRMPLLFFISGAGTLSAMKRRSIREFVIERHKRLLIPILFGFFVIVPPQIYYERFDQFEGFWSFYPEVFNFIPYPEGSLSWHHLWFIVYLLVYSLISIPLLSYLQQKKSKGFLKKLEAISQKKGTLLWVLVPVLISQIVLRPFFPEQTHALVDDWAFFVYYYLFYVAGMFVCASPFLWNKLKEDRHFHLAVGLLTMGVVLALYWGGYWFNDFDIVEQVLFAILGIVMAWSWVFTFLGYGQVSLNFNKPILQHLNEASYPFYILHQTAIIGIGFHVVQWDGPIYAKFLIIFFGAFITSATVYWFFIRPFNVMRFLFGMKPKVGSKQIQSWLPVKREKLLG